MPAYDYRCAKHGTFEVVCAISECTPQKECPQCGRPAERFFGGQAISIGGLTNRAYTRGYVNGNQFDYDEETGDDYRNMAKRAGVSITGKVYRHSLAQFPGDPEAWVSDSDDARAVMKRRGAKRIDIKDGVLVGRKEIDDIPESKVNHGTDRAA